MSTKLEDLRKVCPRCGGTGSIEVSNHEDAKHSFQDQCPECAAHFVVPALVSDLVEALLEQGAEEVTLFGPLIVPARYDPQYDLTFEQGRYLVFRIPEEVGRECR
jgi:ribosomal protein S27AE